MIEKISTKLQDIPASISVIENQVIDSDNWFSDEHILLPLKNLTEAKASDLRNRKVIILERFRTFKIKGILLKYWFVEKGIPARPQPLCIEVEYPDIPLLPLKADSGKIIYLDARIVRYLERILKEPLEYFIQTDRAPVQIRGKDKEKLLAIIMPRKAS